MFLELDNLTFKYPGTGQPILAAFSLEVAGGETVALLGPSGSGKSTVLRLIAGLEAPDEGRILIGGRVVADRTIFVPPEKRHIGMIFQDYALFPHLTVAENITFGISSLPRRQRAERLDDLLALIRMAQFKDRYPYQLSGGQQQRVAVARALAPRPLLLLMDEPFSNIDCELRSALRRDLREILTTERATCVFVTHDAADVAEMSDRTINVSPVS